MKPLMPLDIIKKKSEGHKITMLTAYEFGMAKLLDEAGIDIILVGDSLGNVFNGCDSTVPVTLSQMIYHTQAVVRGTTHALVVADMPFLSYQISIESAKRNAGLLLKKGGAHAVKLEINESQLDLVKAIYHMGIPVMGHIGFTPQSVYQLGGYKVQGKEKNSAEKLLALAKALEQAGCFSLVLELVPSELATHIAQALSIPVIGIGAGPGCDGQVLVSQDVLGMYRFDKPPKFVKSYAHLNTVMKTAILDFKKEVLAGLYPNAEHSY